MKMFVQRTWRIKDRLSSGSLVSRSQGVPGFEWQGVDIDALPRHLAEMAAAEYVAVRSMFLWLGEPGLAVAVPGRHPRRLATDDPRDRCGDVIFWSPARCDTDARGGRLLAASIVPRDAIVVGLLALTAGLLCRRPARARRSTSATGACSRRPAPATPSGRRRGGARQTRRHGGPRGTGGGPIGVGGSSRAARPGRGGAGNTVGSAGTTGTGGTGEHRRHRRHGRQHGRPRRHDRRRRAAAARPAPRERRGRPARRGSAGTTGGSAAGRRAAATAGAAGTTGTRRSRRARAAARRSGRHDRHGRNGGHRRRRPGRAGAAARPAAAAPRAPTASTTFKLMGYAFPPAMPCSACIDNGTSLETQVQDDDRLPRDELPVHAATARRTVSTWSAAAACSRPA